MSTADDLFTGTERLSRRQVEDLAGVRLPSDPAFAITRYRPPGPVGESYIWSKGPIDAIMGPGGSGKTVASIFKGQVFCLNTMPVCTDGVIRAKLTVVRDNYRSLYRTTMQSWFQWFPTEQHPLFFGGQDRPARHELRLATVRTIKGVAREVPVNITVEFFAIADVNYELLFKSYETSAAWATEADGVPHEAIPFFYGRTARFPSRMMLEEGQELPRLAMLDLNPPDPEHPLYQACLRGSFREDFDPATMQRTINFFVQPGGLDEQAENRAGKTKAAYEEEARTLTKDQARRMVHGKPGRVKDGLPVFDEEWDDDLHVSKVPLAIMPDEPLHIGFDQGGLSPAAALMQVDGRGQVRVLRELAPPHGCGVERFLEQLIPMLTTTFRNVPPGIFASDPAGFYGADKVYGQLAWAETVSKALGHRVIPAPTNEWGLRRDALSMIMRRNLSAGVPALIIDPACKLLRKALSTGYKYQKRHDGTYEPRPIKNAASDIVDAVTYGVLAVKGLAGSINELAAAGRPGNVVPMRRPQTRIGSDFNVFDI